MNDPLSELQKVLRLCGATYSSDEVLDLVGWAAAEIGRLRAALETIAEHNDCCSDFPHNMKNLQRYARAALAKEGGK